MTRRCSRQPGYWSAGNCNAGGTYTDSAKHLQAFVVSDMSGSWRTAIEAPGTAALNTGGSAFINSVSCISAGRCGAAGGYTGNAGHLQGLAITQS
jgi:hypothetical protein